MHPERLSKFERAFYRLLQILVRSSFLLGASLLIVHSRPPNELEKVLESGSLRIISRNGPTTYYEGPEGMTGFEYELVSRLADELNVELKITEIEDLSQILNSVGSEQGAFAAAGLTATPKRKKSVRFSESYFSVKQRLVYRAGSTKPKTIEDLYDKKILVIANSSHAENLRQLKREYPELRWEEVFDIEQVELLEKVHEGEIDHTIIDSNSYDINTTVYPRARLAFDISEEESLAWAFPITRDKSLYNRVNQFLVSLEESGKLNEIRERYYGHVGELNYSDSLLFARRLESRLPKWENSLKNAAEQTGLDWRMLAALSYQESHWNPKAVSPTGVKGFMMLTLPTAKEVGIKNRLNAEQSIIGGAKYFAKIHARVPDRIAEPDRTWLALAAYNQGFGHLEDARILTEHRGANPDRWSDVREDLLNLSKRKYYKFTKHGYARGWEAVNYVQNIRNYYSIIAWHDKETNQQLAIEEESQDYAEFGPVVRETIKTISGSSAEL